MANRRFLLYLSRSAMDNIDVVVAAGTWGVPGDAVSRHLKWQDGATGLEIMQDMQVGDHILAGYGGPNPRPRGGTWDDAALRGGFLWRVTWPYRYDDSVLWPAPTDKPRERWPHRFGIELLERLSPLTKDDLGVEGMEAMRYSAVNRGILVGPHDQIPSSEPT